MYSLVMIDLDENEKVLKVEDRWNGDEQPTRFGAYVRNHLQCLATRTELTQLQWLRKLNARLVPWFVSIPKDEEFPGSTVASSQREL